MPPGTVSDGAMGPLTGDGSDPDPAATPLVGPENDRSGRRLSGAPDEPFGVRAPEGDGGFPG
jgi:hypothetical protein